MGLRHLHGTAVEFRSVQEIAEGVYAAAQDLGPTDIQKCKSVRGQFFCSEDTDSELLSPGCRCHISTYQYLTFHKLFIDRRLLFDRLVSYKRIDLAVEAFNRNGLKLYIVGDGPDRKRLEGMAKDNVSFLGRLEDEQVTGLMAQCRAFIFPGEEDFGITPLEANAAGRPVIAYQAGGALDTIIPYVNGVFFEHQEVDDLLKAIYEVESYAWDIDQIMGHARKFDEQAFMIQFKQYVEQAYVNFLKGE